MLKVDLHLHTNEDPKHLDLKYSPIQLIDQAAKQGYDVLALTYHDKVAQISKELERHAKSKNIVLISGVERTIQKSHVLIYNITEAESQALNSLEDLAELKQKNKNIFVIAPHPFHIGETCLKHKLKQYVNLFDALEYSWFYARVINPNHTTRKFATKHNLPLVGNSDLHRLDALGTTYTLVDANKDKKSVFAAIKQNKIKLVTYPLPFFRFFRIASVLMIEHWINSLKIRIKR
jgi:predicted metal-dependent phosphoesterase TrpH